jgi:hypothetical protein
MKNQPDKWSIQISRRLYETIKTFCKDRGYKISGFAEKSIILSISGSIASENKL